MMRFEVSPEAQRDLADIRDYLAREAGREVAAKVLVELRNGVRKLSDEPGLGHLREDLAAGDLRFYRVFKYLIVYRVRNQTLGVVRVLHGARDVAAVLRRNL